jgi:hypothetical protein
VSLVDFGSVQNVYINRLGTGGLGWLQAQLFSRQADWGAVSDRYDLNSLLFYGGLFGFALLMTAAF